ncbi:MAG: hypothetical protein KDJ45_16145, partial [Hyphomicrobiaceae bacterium]|nr:hypothetical protein [Hyphomicrobiaceae bacterium]
GFRSLPGARFFLGGALTGGLFLSLALTFGFRGLPGALFFLGGALTSGLFVRFSLLLSRCLIGLFLLRRALTLSFFFCFATRFGFSLQPFLFLLKALQLVWRFLLWGFVVLWQTPLVNERGKITLCVCRSAACQQRER